jgi:hypothetical protein
MYDRLITMINNKKTSYQTKIICIKVLGLIGNKLKGIAEIIIGFYQAEIIYTLENACKDRIHKVQLAAGEALRIWRELEDIFTELEQKKLQLNRNTFLNLADLANSDKEGLLKSDYNYKMNKLNMLRNLSKLNKEKKDDVYKKGIGSSLRTSKFMNDRVRASSTRERKMSPNNAVKESIKNYISNMPKTTYSNDYNELNIDDLDFDHHNLSKKNFNKNEEIKDLIDDNISEIRNIDEANTIEEVEHKEEQTKIEVSKIENTKIENPKYEPIKDNLTKLKNIPTLKDEIKHMFEKSFSQISTLERKMNNRMEILDKRIKENSHKIVTYVKTLDNKKKNDIKLNEKNFKEKIFILQKQLENAKLKEAEPPIIKIWKNVLKEVDLGDLNRAYSQVLSTGDDIYLLRLICITGPVLHKLEYDIAKNVLLRVNMISRSHKIQSLVFSLILNSYDTELFYRLTQNEQNEILETLFEYSAIDNAIGSNSADLYGNITSNKIK